MRLVQVAGFVCVQLALSAGAEGAGPVAVAGPQSPIGVINTSVRNLSTGSITNGSNTPNTAQPVFRGDTLVYQIVITNQATGIGGSMTNTVITDSVPAGLDAVGQDDLNVGTVAPMTSVLRTITVKIDIAATGTIKNQACFTGNSADGTQPQSGCNFALITIVRPGTGAGAPPTAAPTPSVSASPQPSSSTLPSPANSSSPQPAGQGSITDPSPPVLTGTGALGATGLGASAIAAATYAYLRSRRRK
jgi:Domain of unknown function DUF11